MNKHSQIKNSLYNKPKQKLHPYRIGVFACFNWRNSGVAVMLNKTNGAPKNERLERNIVNYFFPQTSGSASHLGRQRSWLLVLGLSCRQ